MIQNVYTIKDAKTNAFANPFYSVNDATAIRSFEQAAADPNTTISQFPEDFSLYKLGTFTDESGQFTLEETPKFIANPTIKTNE